MLTSAGKSVSFCCQENQIACPPSCYIPRAELMMTINQVYCRIDQTYVYVRYVIYILFDYPTVLLSYFVIFSSG